MHLADIEDHADGWKAYKSSRFIIDEELRALVRDFARRHRRDTPLTLVLNGDIIDFDLVIATPEHPPWPVSPFERERGLDATEPKSAWKLQYILAQHPVFIDTLAEFIGAGNRVVYVLGNHDREVHFTEVQHVLVRAVMARLADAGKEAPAGSLRFERWFYYVPGELYVEHGHQFDHYSSFKDILEPTVESHAGPMVALPMANLSNRYLGTRMGFFNPHSTDFILNLFAYFGHWLKHYAFSKRNLVLNWFWGSLLVIWQLLRVRKRQILKTRDTAVLQAEADRYGLPLTTLIALRRLQTPPIVDRLYRVVREFWLDRLVMAVFLTLGTITLALLPVPTWAKVMVPFSAFPTLFFLYEWIAQGDTVFTVEQRLPRFARAVAELLPVRVVTFGHTHRPRTVPLGKDTCFVDTGAWAAMTEKLDSTSLTPGMRNYLELGFAEEGISVRLDSWMTAPNALLQPASNEDAAVAISHQTCAEAGRGASRATG